MEVMSINASPQILCSCHTVAAGYLHLGMNLVPPDGVLPDLSLDMTSSEG